MQVLQSVKPIIRPKRLDPADADRYAKLRSSMLRDSPWAFAASPEDDRTLDRAYIREYLADAERAVFAVAAHEDSERLVASAGIFRVTQRKARHRARLWGVFVEPPFRGCGLGRRVVNAALELARSWPGVDFVDLGVSQNSPNAEALYASLGFVAWGREPDSLDCDGHRYNEIFMSLRL